MPIYEYHCENCDRNFEIMKSFLKYKKKENCLICKKQSKRNYHGNKTALVFGKGFFKTGGY